jgi:hypothetical protein
MQVVKNCVCVGTYVLVCMDLRGEFGLGVARGCSESTCLSTCASTGQCGQA